MIQTLPWSRPGLWSLWDMLRLNANRFVEMGRLIHDGVTELYFNDADPVSGHAGKVLTAEARADLQAKMLAIANLAATMGLSVTEDIAKEKSQDQQHPATSGEFELVARVLQSEMNSRLFLYVPGHRASLYESAALVDEATKVAFPQAHAELLAAGNCFALGLYTASAYHCMRALEHGLRALANDVGQSFTTQNWHNIINEVESILDTRRNAKGAKQDARIGFLSEAATNFRHFKDAWRNHVAHSRVTYSEQQAHTILAHCRSFFDGLAPHLKE